MPMTSQRSGVRASCLGPATRAYTRVLFRDPCAYCGAPPTNHRHLTTIDHIEPWSRVDRLAQLHWTNLTAACARCNAAKSDRTLLDCLILAGQTLLVSSERFNAAFLELRDRHVYALHLIDTAEKAFKELRQYVLEEKASCVKQ